MKLYQVKAYREGYKYQDHVESYSVGDAVKLFLEKYRGTLNDDDITSVKVVGTSVIVTGRNY